MTRYFPGLRQRGTQELVVDRTFRVDPVLGCADLCNALARPHNHDVALACAQFFYDCAIQFGVASKDKPDARSNLVRGVSDSRTLPGGQIQPVADTRALRQSPSRPFLLTG